MVKWVRDITGRFPQRPHFEPAELDQESEATIASFLKQRHGTVAFPVTTDDLTVLLEQETADFDLYADLSDQGDDVEGVTDFRPSSKPVVRISRELSDDPKRENRLRTTLTHELGHVKFHSFLWALERLPLRGLPGEGSPRCKRDSILAAGLNDWMEWQAGYASGAFLMPISRLREVVKELREEAGTLAELSLDTPSGWEIIQRVQASFTVSAEAARVRLLKCGYVVEQMSSASLFDIAT